MLNTVKQWLLPTSATNVLLSFSAKTPTTALDSAAHSSTLSVGSELTKKQLRMARLVMVMADNNNKFYEMSERANGTFDARYGRIGHAGVVRNYPIEQWERKLREKKNKGYFDQSALFSTFKAGEQFAPVADAVVQRLLDSLQAFARRSVFKNYHVSAAEVSERQLNEAQTILNEMTKLVGLKMDAEAYNALLLQLFQVIPRKMRKVKEHLSKRPTSREEVGAIRQQIAEEQATLDVLRGQVACEQASEKQHPLNKTPKTLLEAFGISVSAINNPKIIAEIKNMMGDQKARFRRAYQVTNLRTQRAFEQYVNKASKQSTTLFWHGSRNENLLSILGSGLQLRPTNVVINGKMFGHGLYFADKFQKSLNYSSLSGSCWTNGNAKTGFLSLFEVHTGRQLKIKKHAAWCYQLNADTLQKRGGNYHSVFAMGGADLRNNEYIVYQEAQCTVRYLIEVGL